MANVEQDIDALFSLPLTEFTSARNALSARLKRDNRQAEADFVKALLKPSVSVWAVNQLYWKHREAFDQLIATSQRFREAQAAQLAGNAADMQGSLDTRREALSNLSRLAAELLRDSDHNPTPDIMRRITGTLEAISAYASLPDSPAPGRLTADLDPPGFDALAALIPASGTLVRPKGPAPISSIRQPQPSGEEKVAAAKVSLRNAEGVLREARNNAKEALVALKRADSAVKEADTQKREAQERFKAASVAWEEANRHARTVEAEARNAAKAVEDAERAVEQASNEIQLLLSKLAGRK
jgi:hypothetical protein